MAVKKSFAGRPYFSGASLIAPVKKYGSHNDLADRHTAPSMTMRPYSISIVGCQVDKLEKFLRALSLEQRLCVSRSFEILGINLTALLRDSRFTLPVYDLSVGDTVSVVDGSTTSDYVVKRFRSVNGCQDAFIVNPLTRFGFWVSVKLLKIQVKDKKRNG